MLGFHTMPKGFFLPSSSSRIIRQNRVKPNSMKTRSPPIEFVDKQNRIHTIKNTVVLPPNSTEERSGPVAFSQKEQWKQHVDRELNEIRQQQILIINKLHEDSSDSTAIVRQLSELKQRLVKTLQEAENSAASTSSSSQRRDAKLLEQLKAETNWMYATVQVPSLNYSVEPSEHSQTSGVLHHFNRVLVLYKTFENDEGLWMQIRLSEYPEKRFWIKLSDIHNNVTIGSFAIHY